MVQNSIFEDKKVVFVCGLHRSGTSVLNKVLSSQKDVSGFENTNVPRNEGQHLQTVFNPASFYGGAGKFGFDPNAKLDESSHLLTTENILKLQKEWGRLWDLKKCILIEKSPPNLIRTRFLQGAFPVTYFITILRHPIAVSYATKKWSKTSLEDLVDHWVKCHSIYFEDERNLKNRITIYYEDLVANPEKVLASIGNFLNAEMTYSGEFQNENYKYFKRWNSCLFKIQHNLNKKRIVKRYENSVNEFGYSLVDLDKHGVS